MIEKVHQGRYKIENSKEYNFKILKGGQLAIKMFGGYLYVESLIHFDVEGNKILST
jgi:hypothetical protein